MQIACFVDEPKDTFGFIHYLVFVSQIILYHHQFLTSPYCFSGFSSVLVYIHESLNVFMWTSLIPRFATFTCDRNFELKDASITRTDMELYLELATNQKKGLKLEEIN